IPKLPDGVDSYLTVYGAHLIEYAFDENQIKIAGFLLNHGAQIEVHDRKKTILFEATEKGNVEFVALLLLRGANITGEFDFNKETAISISAFKMNKIAIDLLRRYSHLIPTFHKSIQSKMKDHIDTWNSIFKRKDRRAPWVLFSESNQLRFEFSRQGLRIINWLGKRKTVKADKDFKESQNHIKIYRLLHDKFAIAKNRALLDQKGYFNTLKAGKTYRLLPIGSPKLRNPILKEQALKKVLVTLNQELSQCKEMDIGWNKYPGLYIA
ncbi:unnamed protein product, partial [marine sediment metagenome]